MAITKEELQVIITSQDKASGIFKKLGGSLQTIGKIAGGVALAGVAALGAGISLLVSQAIPAASDLEESMNKVDVVFGDLAGSIKDFAKTAATSLGQSEAQALEAAGTYGNLFTAIGVIPEVAAEMSVGLVTLASDLASFNNASPEEVLLAMRSAMTGELEPMKRFGVAINQATILEYALKEGIIDTKDELDAAAKSTAIYGLIMEQTATAQGDFARTSEGLANSQRIVEAQMEDLKATIGSFLLPVAEKFFGFISKTALPILTTFAKYIGFVVEDGDYLNDFLADLPGWLKPVALTIGKVVAAFKDFFEGLATGEDIIGDVSNLAWRLGQAFGMTKAEAAAFFFQVQKLIMSLIAFKDRAMEAITPIIEFIANTVTWKDVLIALGIAIAAVVIPAIISLLATILPIIAVAALVIGAVTLIRMAWENNWGGIQEKTAQVIVFIRNLITNTLNWLTDFWDKHGEQIIATAINLWNTVREATKTFVAWLTTTITNILNWVRDFWTAHGEQIMGIVQTIWDTVVGIFQWFVDYYTLIFEAFSAAFSGDWETFGEKLREAWDMVWDAIVTAVEIAWEFISTAVSEGIENIITWFKETDWGQVGRDIIQGIANGITAAATLIKAAALAAAKAAWEAVKGFFGIESPSKLMVDLGVDLMKGMAIGITGGSGLPAMAAVGAGAGIANAMTSTTHQTMTILGGINMYGIEDRESFLEEISGLMV